MPVYIYISGNNVSTCMTGSVKKIPKYRNIKGIYRKVKHTWLVSISHLKQSSLQYNTTALRKMAEKLAES